MSDDYSAYLRALTNKGQPTYADAIEALLNAMQQVQKNDESANRLFQTIANTLNSHAATLNHVRQITDGYEARIATLERDLERLRDRLTATDTQFK